jgi:EthD domain
MEKVIAVLRRADADDDWCARQRGPVADELLDLGVCGLVVNVRDGAVRHSLMTLTTLDPPVAAVVSLWTQQCYGDQMTAALGLLAAECEQLSAYLVTESVPMPGPASESGSRTTGLANIALLRRPTGMYLETWLDRWQGDHTPVAIATQSTFGYTQNWVVRTLTPDAPGIAGIVEELFPSEAICDLKAFFGAADDDDLQDRLGRMIASTTAFGANENIDTVPTSRYVFKTPFESWGSHDNTQRRRSVGSG